MRIETIDQRVNVDLAVRGVLHLPSAARHGTLVFAHGAGGDRDSALVTAIAEEFSTAGFRVLRIDLPFRQRRPSGPPSPSRATLDRAGLAAAVELMHRRFAGPVFLGGQSYGGRQATMLAAEQPSLADALLLTSYPLHPPGKPERLRTEHFPKLTTPALFAHGTKDGFGTIEEMEAALALMPGRRELFVVEGGGHGLVSKRQGEERLHAVVRDVRGAFTAFVDHGAGGPR